MHIGQLIFQKMKERHISVVDLAKKMNCSRTNIYKIFEKESIDTQLLFRFSIILDFDFFNCYSREICLKKKMQS
ncbi:helix-turn-helix domain-containing protein [uncultured Bacteroides sp.]|jgi:plasmid maintenance system antidote protein VapI|uniref:helix-turn-helix domain-containing protein n=1 Tax=uncultured Bacteroides sp. TaxID=162156 RepID=UPI003458B6B6